MKDEHVIYLVGAVGFLLGIVLTVIVSTLSHRNHHQIVKTNIGEFILKDGKIFTVYEMQRNINGDMVGR